MSLNRKPGIVTNPISIRKQCFITSCATSIFVCDIGRDNLFQGFTHLTKENLDKAKDFSSLKFSICLNQREIIHLMDEQDIDFLKSLFQMQMNSFDVFIASPIQ